MTTLTIVPLTEDNELLCHYSSEHRPQPCVLWLDLEDGEMSARYNPEIGNGIPMSVHLGRTRWVEIPLLTTAAANALLEEVAPLAERILAGSRIEWDGNNNRGYLDEDADAALEELTERCDPAGLQWDDADLIVETDE